MTPDDEAEQFLRAWPTGRHGSSPTSPTGGTKPSTAKIERLREDNDLPGEDFAVVAVTVGGPSEFDAV